MGKITVTEAARVIGVSPQFVRVAMQQDKLKIGTAIKMSSKWAYHISPELLSIYTGITKEKLLEGATND